MQQLEAGNRITIRTVRVDWSIRTTAIVENAAEVSLANETDVRGNLQHSGVFNGNVAEESQSVAAHIIEPIFADGGIRLPVCVSTPGEVRGRLPHPRQPRGPCAHA